MQGTQFKMVGTSDYPICDCCGKTNLVRAVVVANEFAEEFNIGTICASKVLRQMYQGKKHKLSSDAVMSMGRGAKASAEWKKRNNWVSPTLVAA